MGDYANSPGPGFVAFIHLRSIPLPNRSLARQFEQEAQSRAIQGCTDIEELRDVAMSLLKAWHMQAEMTQHFGAQAMGAPGRGGQLI
jgi:hypothetical protein